MKSLPLILVLILSGCGADSDSESDVALKDIQGTWYESYDDDGINVEEYTVIRDSGDLMEYDYRASENCYNTYTNIVSNEIIFKGTENDGAGYEERLTKSDFPESYFTDLLCD